jgi:dihydrofolate reductase
MRPLRYSINVTLDGCCDHRAIPTDDELHRHAAENLAQADALLFGRVTYEMMEAAWRPPARTGERPEWMEPWMEPFARTIDAAKKYVVSSALDQVDWNAELVRGDLGNAVQQLKRGSGKGLFVAGVKLALALTELGLIDEYEFVVPRGTCTRGTRSSSSSMGLLTPAAGTITPKTLVNPSTNGSGRVHVSPPMGGMTSPVSALIGSMLNRQLPDW